MMEVLNATEILLRMTAAFLWPQNQKLFTEVCIYHNPGETQRNRKGAWGRRWSMWFALHHTVLLTGRQTGR